MGTQDEGQIGAIVCPALGLGDMPPEMTASLWPLRFHSPACLPLGSQL